MAQLSPAAEVIGGGQRARIGVGLIGFGWLGQAHSRSLLRIPTLFADREFDTELVICADNVPARQGEAVDGLRLRARRRPTGGAWSSTRTSTSSTSPPRTCSTSS